MRDPHVIATEIDHARHDLDESLGALKALVRDKLDVKQRIRNAIDRRLHQLGDAVQRIRADARQHPVAALAVCVAITLVYVQFRRRRR